VKGRAIVLKGHLEADEEMQLTMGVLRLIRIEIFGVQFYWICYWVARPSLQLPGIPAILRDVIPQMNMRGVLRA
jgi:hypothetical protein